MEEVKICVMLHLMKHVNAQLFFTMCKCTKLTKLTFVRLIWKCLTKFCLIFLRMIKLLNSVMCEMAIISIWTAFLGVLALDWGVGSERPAPILLVIIDAFFHVVSFQNRTRLSLESVQIEKINTLRMGSRHCFFPDHINSIHSTFRRLFLCLSMGPCRLTRTLVYFCISKTM